jgi:hypothetical protein
VHYVCCRAKGSSVLEDFDYGTPSDQNLESSVDVLGGEPLRFRVSFLLLTVEDIADNAICSFGLVLFVGVSRVILISID